MWVNSRGRVRTNDLPGWRVIEKVDVLIVMGEKFLVGDFSA
jgi:hypothetical protein